MVNYQLAYNTFLNHIDFDSNQLLVEFKQGGTNILFIFINNNGRLQTNAQWPDLSNVDEILQVEESDKEKQAVVENKERLDESVPNINTCDVNVSNYTPSANYWYLKIFHKN